MSAVTLAVAALPEEFPVVFASFLGVGIYRLARRQALVRRAVVVENIGRVTCICSDKTGTLTEGRLQLAHLAPADEIAADRLLAVAATASRAGAGDPLDAAILAASGGVPGEAIATFPFTEDRRRRVRGDPPARRRRTVRHERCTRDDIRPGIPDGGAAHSVDRAHERACRNGPQGHRVR